VTNVVIINFDGMFVSRKSGQSTSEKESEGFIFFNDPKLKAELVASGYFCCNYFYQIMIYKTKRGFLYYIAIIKLYITYFNYSIKYYLSGSVWSSLD
jgi:hypothetical protein